ncbi:MAG: shikimate dehydrogenase, partial [Bacteroidota bacterium]
AHHLAYDLVYTPRHTRFLQLAETAGAAIQGGLDMFIGQAAAAYVQWTRQTMPLDVVRRALDSGVDASSDAGT